MKKLFVVLFVLIYLNGFGQKTKYANDFEKWPIMNSKTEIEINCMESANPFREIFLYNKEGYVVFHKKVDNVAEYKLNMDSYPKGWYRICVTYKIGIISYQFYNKK